MRTLKNRVRGQAGVEYMLAVSVVVIGIAGAFWLIFADSRDPGPSGGGPAQRSFENVAKVIEAPYP